MAQGHLRGLLYALLGCSFFGLSGVAAQVLFQYYHVTPQWLVTLRMVGAGSVLLLWLRPTFPRKRVILFICFALVGVAGVQYTYFSTIAYTNAATATFLQYLGIPLIALYEIVFLRRKLTLARTLALFMALLGAFLLILGGHNESIALGTNPLIILLGTSVALAAAVFIVGSAFFTSELGAWPTTTWGLLLGGMMTVFWAPPWEVQPAGNLVIFALLVLFVVFIGTLAAFGFFLTSLKYISATEAGIAATMEPVSAAIASFALLHVILYPLQYLGGFLILIAVLLLHRKEAA